MAYAENTTVSTERSRAEIESLLRKYGASGFGYLWRGDSAVVMFEMMDRRVRFVLPLPPRDNEKYRTTPTGRSRRRITEDQINQLWEQDCRSRWRSLTLCIKAKLESVAAKIETFEEAFLPHIVLPDNSTVGAWMIPQVEQAYLNRKMPPMLPAAGGVK